MGSLRFIFNYTDRTNLNSPLFINNAWVCVYRCLINLCLRQLKARKIPQGGSGERLRRAGVVAVPAWWQCQPGCGASVVTLTAWPLCWHGGGARVIMVPTWSL